jgi:hypothetical protein
MRIIINAEPDEMHDVLDLILEHRADFERPPSRPGWGWHFQTKSGRRFFLREIKGGVSASPTPSAKERRC